jgi:hypothetical protein
LIFIFDISIPNYTTYSCFMFSHFSGIKVFNVNAWIDFLSSSIALNKKTYDGNLKKYSNRYALHYALIDVDQVEEHLQIF